MRLITDARADGGPFAGLFDFAARVDLRRVGKRALEMLARAGALDALDSNRRKVFESLEALMAWSGAAHDERASAQVSLFGEATDALPAPRLPQPEDWSPMERLAQEHQAIGFYLSGHPLDDYAGALRRERVADPRRARPRRRRRRRRRSRRSPARSPRVDLRKSARGNRFAFVRLSDPTGLYEVRMFSDVLDGARDHLEPGRSVVLTVEATLEGDELQAPRQGGAADRRRGRRRRERGPAGSSSTTPARRRSLAARLDSVARDAGSGAAGRSTWSLMHPELPGEVEIALPDPYPMTPAGPAAR